VVEIKFCGLTRPEDAAHAAALGAAYVGVIFAGGPRALTVARATDVLRGLPAAVRRVGVFGDQSPDEIGGIAGQLELDVVQLHGRTTPDRVAAIRRGFRGSVWPVVRVTSDGALPAALRELIELGDGLLLDAFVPGMLGGSGVAIPWAAVSSELDGLRASKPIVLAGGLRPDNVGEAIAFLAPDVVDVSSGVESAPGIKDHGRMLAFRDAVALASTSI
jgi:phosphoribosylanthranilate isomerase